MNKSFDVKRYEEQREILRSRFLADKTGDQTFLAKQERLLNPLLEA